MVLDKIKSQILEIADNDLGKNLNELDALKAFELREDKLFIQIALVPPINIIEGEIRNKVSEIINEIEKNVEWELQIDKVNIPLSPRKFLKEVKHIVAVAAGKGGVGKSAVASNLAASLASSGAKVGLVDGDIYGPSQPTIWGMKDAKLPAMPAPDGSTIVFPAEKFGVKIASMGFLMKENEAAIVRGPILAGYLQMLIEQIEWGELDFLVFDLPPGTGDIQLTLTQQTPLTGAVVVTTPQEISVIDVRRSVKMFEKVKVPVIGIIENMSYFIPHDAPEKKYYIFGQGGGRRIADESNVPFLGEIPLLEKFRETNDNGTPFVLSHESGIYGAQIHEIVANIVQEIRKINYQKINTSELTIEL